MADNTKMAVSIVRARTFEMLANLYQALQPRREPFLAFITVKTEASKHPLLLKSLIQI